MSGYPITFSVEGKQYVAVATGPSGEANSTLRLTPELRPSATTQVVVFALPWRSASRVARVAAGNRWVLAENGPLRVLITVVALPISMRLCDPRVAATQFTLYMATANFGTSVGAWVLGFSRQLNGLPMMFVMVFALHLVGLLLVVLVKFPGRTAVEAEVAAQLAQGEGPELVIN